MIIELLKKHGVKILILLAITSVVAWLVYDPTSNVVENVPGMDKRLAASEAAKEEVKIGDKFETFIQQELIPSEYSWTRFRGADFDNISKEKTRLIEKWGSEGAKVLWTVKLGEGHAAPVIQHNRVFLLDYDEQNRSDALRCFSLQDGKELWRRSYKVRIKRNHGMSRTVPAITDKYILTIGPRCHVMCCNPANGDFIWGLDLEKQYQTEAPFWYTGQCPLIVNDTAIIAPGGAALLIGVECSTGKVVWETPNPKKLKMSHSSVLPMTFKGKKMYVYSAIGATVGISAEGADLGKVLWEFTQWNPSVIAPSALPVDDGKIYLTAGYGAGSMMIQLAVENGVYTASTLNKLKPNEGLASEQQTPIYYDGHLFGILPKDAGEMRNRFVCCKPSNTGKILWSSDKADKFGLGPYIIADNKFFILNDNGELTIAKVTTKSFVKLDKLKVMEGEDAWGPLAIAGGLMVLRDSKHMICIDLRAN